MPNNAINPDNATGRVMRSEIRHFTNLSFHANRFAACELIIAPEI